jgi:hypothetical protein
MMDGMCMKKSKSSSWVIPVIGTYDGYIQQQSSFFPSQTVDFIMCCVLYLLRKCCATTCRKRKIILA